MLPIPKARAVGRLLFPQKKGAAATVKLAPLLEQAARAERDEVLRLLDTRESGLTEAEAAAARAGTRHARGSSARTSARHHCQLCRPKRVLWPVRESCLEARARGKVEGQVGADGSPRLTAPF